MKTIRLLFIIVLLFSYLENNAQIKSWPPPGAVWYYLNTGSDENCKYIKLYKQKDTIISLNDTNVSSVQMNLEYLDSNLQFIGDSSFILTSDSTGQEIYRLGYFANYASKDILSFFLLYGKESGKGEVFYKDTSTNIKYSVSFIEAGTINIGGNVFKKYNFGPTQHHCIKFKGIYIEHIGSLDYFLFYDTCSSFGYAGKLSCYYDSSLGVFNTGIEEKCICEKIGLGIDDELKHNRAEVIVYPNPSSSIVYLKIPENLNLVEYKLFEINGRELFSRSGNNIPLQLNLNDFQGNLFLLKIVTSSGISIHKLIKIQ